MEYIRLTVQNFCHCLFLFLLASIQEATVWSYRKETVNRCSERTHLVFGLWIYGILCPRMLHLLRLAVNSLKNRFDRHCSHQRYSYNWEDFQFLRSVYRPNWPILDCTTTTTTTTRLWHQMQPPTCMQLACNRMQLRNLAAKTCSPDASKSGQCGHNSLIIGFHQHNNRPQTKLTHFYAYMTNTDRSLSWHRPRVRLAWQDWFTQKYEGRSINKLQNGTIPMIPLILKIGTIRNIRFVGNLILNIPKKKFFWMTTSLLWRHLVTEQSMCVLRMLKR